MALKDLLTDLSNFQYTDYGGAGINNTQIGGRHGVPDSPIDNSDFDNGVGFGVDPNSSAQSFNVRGYTITGNKRFIVNFGGDIIDNEGSIYGLGVFNQIAGLGGGSPYYGNLLPITPRGSIYRDDSGNYQVPQEGGNTLPPGGVSGIVGFKGDQVTFNIPQITSTGPEQFVVQPFSDTPYIQNAHGSSFMNRLPYDSKVQNKNTLTHDVSMINLTGPTTEVYQTTINTQPVAAGAHGSDFNTTPIQAYSSIFSNADGTFGLLTSIDSKFSPDDFYVGSSNRGPTSFGEFKQFSRGDGSLKRIKLDSPNFDPDDDREFTFKDSIPYNLEARDDSTTGFDQPFVLRPIGNTWGLDNPSGDGFFSKVGGFLSEIDAAVGDITRGAPGFTGLISRTLFDAVRLGKFALTPKGIFFIAKQYGLQALNPRPETRVYNPLSLSSIAPFVHMDRHLDSGTYEQAIGDDPFFGGGGNGSILDQYGNAVVSPVPSDGLTAATMERATLAHAVAMVPSSGGQISIPGIPEIKVDILSGNIRSLSSNTFADEDGIGNSIPNSNKYERGFRYVAQSGVGIIPARNPEAGIRNKLLGSRFPGSALTEKGFDALDEGSIDSVALKDAPRINGRFINERYGPLGIDARYEDFARQSVSDKITIVLGNGTNEEINVPLAYYTKIHTNHSADTIPDVRLGGQKTLLVTSTTKGEGRNFEGKIRTTLLREEKYINFYDKDSRYDSVGDGSGFKNIGVTNADGEISPITQVSNEDYSNFVKGFPAVKKNVLVSNIGDASDNQNEFGPIPFSTTETIFNPFVEPEGNLYIQGKAYIESLNKLEDGKINIGIGNSATIARTFVHSINNRGIVNTQFVGQDFELQVPRTYTYSPFQEENLGFDGEGKYFYNVGNDLNGRGQGEDKTVKGIVDLYRNPLTGEGDRYEDLVKSYAINEKNTGNFGLSDDDKKDPNVKLKNIYIDRNRFVGQDNSNTDEPIRLQEFPLRNQTDNQEGTNQFGQGQALAFVNSPNRIDLTKGNLYGYRKDDDNKRYGFGNVSDRYSNQDGSVLADGVSQLPSSRETLSVQDNQVTLERLFLNRNKELDTSIEVSEDDQLKGEKTTNFPPHQSTITRGNAIERYRTLAYGELPTQTQDGERYSKRSERDINENGKDKPINPKLDRVEADNKENVSYEVRDGIGLIKIQGGEIRGDIREKFDKINMTRYGEDPNDDYIKFKFYDEVNKRHIIFPATLTGLNDQFTPEYSGERYIGRPDQVYVYQGTTREISFDFTVAAMSKQQLLVCWEKLNYLAGLVYPNWISQGQTTRMQAPFMSLTIGDMYVRMPGYLSNLSYQIEDNVNWDIDEGYQLPKVVSVNVGFQHIGKHPLANRGRHFDINWIKELTRREPADGQGAYQLEPRQKGDEVTDLQRILGD